MLVGVCLPRSAELAVAALGIWKAGGAFVPMDPTYPPDRLSFMLEDAQAPVIITTPEIAEKLPSSPAERVYLNGSSKEKWPGTPPPYENALDDLAYVIYTSGSTGVPKGVEITHAGLANLVAWHRGAFQVTEHDRASHVSGLGFDAAVWEMWPYLSAGASLAANKAPPCGVLMT